MPLNPWTNLPARPLRSPARPTRLLVGLLLSILLAGLPDTASQASEIDHTPTASPEQIRQEHLNTGMALLTAGADVAQSAASHANELVMRALGLMGVRYKRGGVNPDTGFDCSGLVRFVFHDALGMKLPHRAEEISRIGEVIKKTDLKPGDLVFYNTLRRTFSHVGIYLGDGRFIHAPASRGKVRVESMDMPYWAKRFNGARRVNTDG